MNKLYSFLYPFVWLYMKLVCPWEASGVENIPEGGVLMCGNHSSMGDPFYVFVSMGRRRQTRVLAKNEIMKWPVVGWIAKKAGVIGVKRGDADVTAIKECMRVLRSGEKLLMFPEGTRVKEGESVDAHSGAAMLATRTGVPILPVYITPNKRKIKKVKVIFGEPYLPQFEGRKATPEDHHRISEDLMKRIRCLGGEA